MTRRVSPSDAAAIEETLTHETEPTKVERLKQQELETKIQLEATTAREAQLRARDVEFASALATEQIQWADLNRRFDELEHQLAAGPPR